MRILSWSGSVSMMDMYAAAPSWAARRETSRRAAMLTYRGAPGQGTRQPTSQ